MGRRWQSAWGAMLVALGLGLVVVVAPGRAEPPKKSAGADEGKKTGVQRVVKRVKDSHDTAAGAQKDIEALNDQALDLTAQYRNVQRRIGSLKVYNDQLRTLLDNQETVIANIQKEIDEVGVIARQVMPLMHRMVDSLARFVELDVPFLIEERKKRVQLLRELLDRADVSNAEKYRRVVEAYQIENEYGRTIEAYKARMNAGGGEKSVEFLRVGRVALVYRTLDGGEYGAWDVKKKAWQVLPSDKYGRQIMAGLRIAREQAAPNLMRVPVHAPEVVK